MSKILNDITINSISLSELQRLLVIANKIDNNDLAVWCSQELNGYKKQISFLEHRRLKTMNIIYS